MHDTRIAFPTTSNQNVFKQHFASSFLFREDFKLNMKKSIKGGDTYWLGHVVKWRDISHTSEVFSFLRIDDGEFGFFRLLFKVGLREREFMRYNKQLSRFMVYIVCNYNLEREVNSCCFYLLQYNNRLRDEQRVQCWLLKCRGVTLEPLDSLRAKHLEENTLTLI